MKYATSTAHRCATSGSTGMPHIDIEVSWTGGAQAFVQQHNQLDHIIPPLRAKNARDKRRQRERERYKQRVEV